MNEFAPSQEVIKIENFIHKNKRKLKIENSKYPVSQKRLFLAMKQLCYLWNNNEKSRNYVRELIYHFLPFDASKKVLEFDNPSEAHDGILRDVKLAGYEEILTIVNRFSNSLEHSNTLAQKQKQQGDFESFEEREDNIRSWIEMQPKEILHCDFGYYANNFNKYLCRESIWALQKFVTYCVQLREPTMLAIASKIHHDSNKRSLNTLGARIEDAQTLQKFAKMGSLR